MKKKEIIEKLKENKKKCVRFNHFGDDNHAILDAQIKVLENGWDETDVYDNIDEEIADEVAEVLAVLDGYTDIADILYPEK